MGANRNYEIAQFQGRTGIKPADGVIAERLRQLQRLAVDLIRTTELDLSGIRDGDGYWSGTDPVLGTVREISRVMGFILEESRWSDPSVGAARPDHPN